MLNETREDYTLFRKEDEMYAIPSAHYKEFQLLSEVAFVRKAGIHLGTLKGDDLVPAHDLAMSICLNPEIPRAELTAEEAVRYLRCDSITVSGITKGWAVVTYHGIALGWIKAIGSRVNNYFPKNQRILMQ
jgi:NOL1/NOP2/fmu family ribosome biogenesis protein